MVTATERDSPKPAFQGSWNRALLGAGRGLSYSNHAPAGRRPPRSPPPLHTSPASPHPPSQIGRLKVEGALGARGGLAAACAPSLGAPRNQRDRPAR